MPVADVKVLRCALTCCLAACSATGNTPLQQVDQVQPKTQHFLPSSANTNAFFLDRSDLHVWIADHWAPTPAAIARAKKDPLAQPAEADPLGNWGQEVQGMRLSLRSNKQEYSVGEPIELIFILRNESGVTHQTFIARDPLAVYKITVLAGRAIVPTKTNLPPRWGSGAGELLHSGYQIVETCELTKRYSLEQPGAYYVYAQRNFATKDAKRVGPVTSGNLIITVKADNPTLPTASNIETNANASVSDSTAVAAVVEKSALPAKPAVIKQPLATRAQKPESAASAQPAASSRPTPFAKSSTDSATGVVAATALPTSRRYDFFAALAVASFGVIAWVLFRAAKRSGT
jgi:hypothetical protein